MTHPELVGRERPLFGLGALGGLIHGVDEVFFAEEAYRAIPAVLLGIAVFALYPRLSPLARGICAVALGLFWLGGIATHWVPAVDDGAEEGDYTSIASVPGGLPFLLLGIAILLRRREPAATA